MREILFSCLAFLGFSLLAIYWSFLGHVNSYVVLFHRCLWTFVALVPFLFYKSAFKEFPELLRRSWRPLLASTFFVTLNWLTYIYAITHHHVFEASLAYFISPLISIGLAYLFLKETLRLKQLVAIGIATCGILYLILAKGVVPKYALIIACSFAAYGILGKKIGGSPILRMSVESLLGTLFLGCFFTAPKEVVAHFITVSPSTQGLLLFSGIASVVPMTLYILAAKRLKFSTVGILSFLLPTFLFLLGIFYFQQSVDFEKMVAMMLIWVAVLLYVSDLVKSARQDAEL